MAYSISQQLTTQFYEWERRGRGWLIADHIVELEPPFVPFFAHSIDAPYIDDGRKHTLVSRIKSWVVPEHIVTVPERVDNEIIPFIDTDDDPALVLYGVTLPKHFAPSNDAMEHCLSMLALCQQPLSFELIADCNAITIQFTCREACAGFVYTQLIAYFPDCIIRQSATDAVLACAQRPDAVYIVDFGFAEEFTRPMATLGKQSLDPYTVLFSTVNQLAQDESIILQVLFCGTINAWGESMMTAVCDERGGSFFIDGPEMPGLAKEKIARPLLAATIKLAAFAPTPDDAVRLLHHSTLALIAASTSPTNALIPLDTPDYTIDRRLSDMVLRQSHRVGMLLNTRELATLVHIPPVKLSKKLLKSTYTTKLAPATLVNQPYVLGINEHYGQSQTVGISDEQRLKHLHIIGGTGQGKSTLLLNLIAQDIQRNTGCCILDPHGDLIDAVLRIVPKERINDVVLIDPSDSEFPVGLNILAAHSDIERELLASDLVALFKRFSTSWGDQLHSVLANAIMAFLYNTQKGHIGDLRKFLIEPTFRAGILATCTDPELVYYWQKEYPLLKTSSIGSILTRLDSFLRPKMIRAMVCQQSGLDFHALVNSNKIVLVKLAQGIIGEENSYLLGAVIVAKLQQAALARQQQTATARTPFFCYIDEFHHFITPSLNTILSGARKYGFGLICVHQDMQQLQRTDSDIASSLMANVGTRICFNLSDTDAKRLQEGFSGFIAEDFQNLTVGNAIVRVNTVDADFSLTIVPHDGAATDYSTEVIAASRGQYSNPVSPIPPRAEPPPPSTTSPTASPEPPTVTPSPLIQTSSLDTVTTVKKEAREHRQLQALIKTMAEQYSYIATVEAPTNDGNGQIDVLLRKDSERIAVEVSMKTDAHWEVHNIVKCLADGCTMVILCSPHAKKLAQIKITALKEIVPALHHQLRFLTPDQLPGFFSSGAVTKLSESTMKGYRVKIKFDEEKRLHNTQAIIQRIIKNQS